MTETAPRLTDDELTALLEAHRVCDGCVSHCGRHCRKCQGFQSNDWPCETWRLATEVKDLRAVRDVARTQSRNYNGFRNAMNEFPEYADAWSEWIDATDEADERLISALGRYEEGGR